MKFKYILWSINTITEFIFSLHHEFWHWLVAHIMSVVTLGDISNISFHVTEYPYVYANEHGSMTQHQVGMMVRHESTKGLNQIYNKLITYAPTFGTVVLFIISPWYMYLLYIPYINTLWLSMGDLRNIRSYKNPKIIGHDLTITNAVDECTSTIIITHTS